MSAPTVVVVGSVNMDLVAKGERLPVPGETVAGASFTTIPGGKGANQAVAAARLGARTAMIACVGDDVFGESLTRVLLADEVDCRGVRVVPGSSGVALIVVDGAGRNGIVVVPGANGQLSPADVDRNEALLAGARVVALQHEVPFETVEHAVGRAHALGKLVILNPAPVRPLPPDLVRRIDYLVVNEIEAQALSGLEVDSAEGAAAAGRRLREAGAANVLVTLGARGVVTVAAGAEPRHDPAPQVKAVDTTAAGDTFIGGLCAGLVEGQPLPEAVRFAQAAAAISVTRFGAQTSIPRRDEVVL
ncbi:MAG TPA: ribokinase [Anaeromyxobacter sp.]|nr:ribokinase [Anaeromyxobacter sp.]